MKQEREKLKSFNKTMIMKILLQHESIFRAELSRMTGLSIPTVMKITNEFISSGLVTEIGKGVSSGGKPPEMLQLIPNARFFIGVDLRGREYRCAVINLQGEILMKHGAQAIDPENIRSFGSPDTIRVVQTLIEQTLDRAGVDRGRVVGIGLGVPLPVDVRSGRIISAEGEDRGEQNIAEVLKEAFGLPVMIENTAKVIALAEKWFGEAVNEDNFSVISIGHGIGSAILIDDEIYSGSNLMSGEVGHMVIDLNGPPCRCGNRGCVEAFASVTALIHYVKEQLAQGQESVLRREKEIEGKVICRAAKLGDALAQNALTRMANYLSVGILNLINLLDINLVLLTGGIIECYPELCDQIDGLVNTRRGSYFGKNRATVKPLLMGADAALIGAATLLIKKVVDSGGTLL